MRIVCKVKTTTIKSGNRHKIWNRRINFRHKFQFFSCQISADQRITRQPILPNSKWKWIVDLFDRDIPFCISITYCSARNNRHIDRITVVVLRIFHRIHICIRHDVSEIQLLMLIIHIVHTAEFNIIFRKNLIFCISKMWQIIRINRLHQLINPLLCCSIRLYLIRNRNQLVSIHIPASIIFLRHRNRSKISSIFSTGNNISISVPNRLI